MKTTLCLKKTRRPIVMLISSYLNNLHILSLLESLLNLSQQDGVFFETQCICITKLWLTDDNNRNSNSFINETEL